MRRLILLAVIISAPHLIAQDVLYYKFDAGGGNRVIN